MIFELTGKPDKIDAFLTMFKGYNILELCRTGVTALERGGKHEHMQKLAQEVGEAQLPLADSISARRRLHCTGAYRMRPYGFLFSFPN